MHTQDSPPLLCAPQVSSREAQDGHHTHVFLSKVDKVLEVDVIPVGFDVVVDEEVELVSDPVLEDEGQDPRRQLQEEDEAEEHRELGWGTQRAGVEEAWHLWTGQSSHDLCREVATVSRLYPLLLKRYPLPALLCVQGK